MNNYRSGKEKARQAAIDFQNSFSEGKSYSWYEISCITSRLEKLAKRYGLVKEFKENGII